MQAYLGGQWVALGDPWTAKPTNAEIQRALRAINGHRVHHDISGWYVVAPDEDEPEDGYSLGFDGRPHYQSEDEAWHAASEEAAQCHN